MKRTRRAGGDVCAQWASLVICEVRNLKNRYRLVLAWDDAVAYGYLGLVEALSRLETREPLRVRAFVRIRVRGAIIDGARLEGGIRRSVYESARRASDLPVHTQLGGALLAHAQLHTLRPKTPEENLLRKEREGGLHALLRELPAGDLEVIMAVYDWTGSGDCGAALARRRGVGRSHITRRHRELKTRLRRQLACADG